MPLLPQSRGQDLSWGWATVQPTKATGPLLSISVMRPRNLVLIALSLGSVSISAQAQMAPSPESQAWLRTVISGGRFSEMRWPDFSDYNRHLQKFYDANGNGLLWIKGLEPTPQALQLIALLLQADQK